MENERKIPLWIVIYAIIQALTSVVGVYGGYIDLSFFYAAQFPDANFTDNLVKHLGGVWASKNVGIIVVMAWALIQRYPRVLGTVFAMKFIQDTIDILYTNNVFYPEPNILQSVITWLLLGLPQAYAAYVLLRRA